MAATLTRRQLADALGCNIRTVAKWQDEGMPVALRGRGGRSSQYDLDACRAWKTARDQVASNGNGMELLVVRARKELAQAIESEQRVAIKARRLADVHRFERLMADDYTRCKAKLLGLARQAKTRLPHLTATDVAALDALVREALEELAGRTSGVAAGDA